MPRHVKLPTSLKNRGVYSLKSMPCSVLANILPQPNTSDQSTLLNASPNFSLSPVTLSLQPTVPYQQYTRRLITDSLEKL
jgi:hypothetical protein